MSDAEASRNTNKRRPRTVATLTHHEIQHKRDLDRRAQRAYRQRTKTRIEDLENDLNRIRASRSDRENQLLQELQCLREQNRHLKSCLQSVSQFALDSIGVSEDTANKNQQFLHSENTNTSDAEECLDDTSWPNDFSVTDDSAQVCDPQIHPQQVSGQDTTEQGDTQGLDKFSCSEETQNSPTTRKNNVGSVTEKGQHRENQTTHTNIYASLVTPNSSPETTPIYPPLIDARIALILPKHDVATCPLDQILLDFLSSRRSLIARGTPVESLLGPEKPDVKAILCPELVNSVHTISRVVSEILLTFSRVNVPEKLGFMCKMHQTLRWQISPTPENYAKMPQWLRPTLAQIAIPHAAWIDNIPWPQVRDMLIEHPEKYPFSVFSELYSEHVSVNWMYDSMDTVIQTDNHEVMLNPLFEKHIQNLSNWTVGPEFEEYLPEMKSALRLSN